MDILPLHIEYLLTRHDCVIVPGIGAFIATETEAFIDLENGVIRPRRR
ncbi:MAG: SPOR domain-containing protein, partial [Muribaculaceae bacterium]|nr:SPOR domain-containing protein [Muribaculaceae bacterium]